MSKWLKTKLQADGVLHIWINNIIGSDALPDWFNEEMGEVNARMFIDEVESHGDVTQIKVFINSNGGDVFAGLAIMNYLRSHAATVTTVVTGVAASIASVIMLAGDEREMALGTQVMTHNPASWLGGFYTAEELRGFADLIDKVRDAVVDAYAAVTGKTPESLVALLDQGDTYMLASEAIEWGFATATVESIPAVACDLPPQAFKAQIKLQGDLHLKAQAVDQLTQQVAAQTAELDRLQALTAPPVAMAATAVISACKVDGLDMLAPVMIEAGLAESAVTAKLAMASAVQNVCVAANLDVATVLAHLDAPDKMLGVVAQAYQAGLSEDIDSTVTIDKPTIKAVSHDQVYKQLNQRAGV